MVGESPFQVEGVITAVLPSGIFRAELSNGHKLLAFLTGKAKASRAELRAGDKVTLQLTPYDLSSGRIVAQAETKKHESSRIH
jgi:translation initiation factor IF-1